MGSQTSASRPARRSTSRCGPSSRSATRDHQRRAGARGCATTSDQRESRSRSPSTWSRAACGATRGSATRPCKSERLSADEARWRVPVPANGEAAVTGDLRHAASDQARCALGRSSLAALARGPRARPSARRSSPRRRPDRVAVTVYRDPDRGLRAAEPAAGSAAMRWSARPGTSACPPATSELRFEGVTGGIVPQSAIVDRAWRSGAREEPRRQAAVAGRPARRLARRARAPSPDLDGDRRGPRTGRDRPRDRRRASSSRPPTGSRRCAAPASPKPCSPTRCRPACRPSRPCRSASRSPRRSSATSPCPTSPTISTGRPIMSPSCRRPADRMSLFAWLTLANGDETGFADAETQAVAGKLNRERRLGRAGPRRGRSAINCWPQGTTSDIPQKSRAASARISSSPPPPPARHGADRHRRRRSPMRGGGEIMAQRGAARRRPALSDPRSRSRSRPGRRSRSRCSKQPAVEVDTIYRLRTDLADDRGRARCASLRAQAANRRGERARPAAAGGQLALFAERDGRPFLIGEGSIDDHAVGEKVEIDVGDGDRRAAPRQTVLGGDGKDTSRARGHQ